MPRIRFEPSGKEVDLAGPLALVDAVDELPGTGVRLACRSSHCGACRVDVERGASSLLPAAPDECETLSALDCAPGQRLACQLRLAAAAHAMVVLRVPR